MRERPSVRALLRSVDDQPDVTLVRAPLVAGGRGVSQREEGDCGATAAQPIRVALVQYRLLAGRSRPRQAGSK